MSELERLRKEYDAAVKRRHGKIGATGLEIRADALIAALGDEIAELTGQNIDLEVWRASAVKRAEQAEAELDELDSYNGHLAWMDKHYPLGVSYFAESEDVGCQVMRLSRKVMEQDRMLRLAYQVKTDEEGRIIPRDEWLADLKARAEEGSRDE